MPRQVREIATVPPDAPYNASSRDQIIQGLVPLGGAIHNPAERQANRRGSEAVPQVPLAIGRSAEVVPLLWVPIQHAAGGTTVQNAEPRGLDSWFTGFSFRCDCDAFNRPLRDADVTEHVL